MPDRRASVWLPAFVVSGKENGSESIRTTAELDRGTLMKAVVYTGPLTLESLEIPAPHPADGEVVIAVSAAGICGSELEGVRSKSPFRVPPLVMGHEFAGVRQDNGQRVAVNPLISCGRCDLCEGGQPEICRKRQLIGVHRAGGFADFVSVPERNCHPLPESVSDIQGALVETFANAVHAWTLGLRLSFGSAPHRIGVIGAGALGLATASLCAREATSDVVICERSAARREEARKLESVTIAEELDDDLDLIFEAVGSAATRQVSVSHIRPGGTAIWIGLHSECAEIRGQEIVRSEKRIAGSFAYSDREFATAISAVSEIQPWWFEAQPLSDGAEVFGALMDHDGAAARTVLVAEHQGKQSVQ